MIRRSSSADRSPATDKACSQDAECKFCATLRRAREFELFDPLPELCSPLTPGVQLVNLSHSRDCRMINAKLGGLWKRMFEQLPLIGEGLVMTRNEAAILGRRMSFPELAFTAHGIKGASEQGGLWFDFRSLGAARAVHLRCESGHIFGVEFASMGGQTIHRFTALPSSDLDMLFGWVRLHQACSEDLSACQAFEEAEISTGTPATGFASCAGAIVSMLSACCERGLGVRVTVQNSAVVQRAHFIPQELQPTGDWWFACDEEMGLHFCPTQFTHAKAVPQVDGGWPRLLFYAQSNAQRPVLTLELDDKWEQSPAT
jgi:putative heme degradation protein